MKTLNFSKLIAGIALVNNGVVIFKGLNGFSVKTHGKSDALAFANAIRYAVELSNADFNSVISERAASVSGIRDELNK